MNKYKTTLSVKPAMSDADTDGFDEFMIDNGYEEYNDETEEYEIVGDEDEAYEEYCEMMLEDGGGHCGFEDVTLTIPVELYNKISNPLVASKYLFVPHMDYDIENYVPADLFIDTENSIAKKDEFTAFIKKAFEDDDEDLLYNLADIYAFEQDYTDSEDFLNDMCTPGEEVFNNENMKLDPFSNTMTYSE